MGFCNDENLQVLRCLKEEVFLYCSLQTNVTVNNLLIFKLFSERNQQTIEC